MPFGRRSVDPDPQAVASLARELVKLDPWSYWTVVLDADAGASFAVLGTTGAFAVRACDLAGYLVAEGRHLMVDGERIGGWRELRSAAKALRGRLLASGASRAEVASLMVLTRAAAGAPRDHAQVRVLRPEDVVGEITRHPRILDPGTAERLARSLGRVLEGPGRAVDG
jgi:hypothetical protein